MWDCAVLLFHPAILTQLTLHLKNQINHFGVIMISRPDMQYHLILYVTNVQRAGLSFCSKQCKSHSGWPAKERNTDDQKHMFTSMSLSLTLLNALKLTLCCIPFYRDMETTSPNHPPQLRRSKLWMECIQNRWGKILHLWKCWWFSNYRYFRYVESLLEDTCKASWSQSRTSSWKYWEQPGF